ncbi:interferon-activable protein 203-like isoform X2 [Microtus oregoni]|uniref:interferon-activable protein 203-like isoform X2 n=1 Tax=Microtus oregoni TaxID=111838 RepID=UPI001BB0F238|nr:interferon-activable protein 203-like isoform X2 [Microtus oregoni]
MSEYKKIVLLKGLECMDNYHFRILKSLLRRELHLSESKQNDYDKIQIADLMEDTFPKDAGLGKLIGFCQEIKDLQYLVKDLKEEKVKVEKQKKGKKKTAVEGKQGEPSSAHGHCSSNAPSSEKEETAGTESGKKRKLNQEQTQPLEPSGSSTQKDEDCLQTSQKPATPSSNSSNKMPSATTSESLLAQPTTSKSLLAPMVSSATTSSISSCETPRRGNIPKEPAKEEGCHREPKEVMVLKVTEPFTYDLILDKRMFHATVATENKFYRVKIFDPVLKNKFIPNKIIAISNYFGSNGFLEIHESSCVSDVDKNRTMDISTTLRKRANATPKIRDLFSQAQGTYVSGEFVVYQKTERSPFIYYGIEDDTGKMEVVVHGRLTNIKCEPGQKLRLICFELSSSTDTWQLKSVRHSNMQVVNVRKKVTLA